MSHSTERANAKLYKALFVVGAETANNGKEPTYDTVSKILQREAEFHNREWKQNKREKREISYKCACGALFRAVPKKDKKGDPSDWKVQSSIVSIHLYFSHRLTMSIVPTSDH